MKIDLNKVRTAKGCPKSADKIIIVGEPGVGKSSLGANFPNPIFLCADGEESGIRKLAEAGTIPESTVWMPEIGIRGDGKTHGWVIFLQALQALAQDEHDYKTVVLDCFDDGGFLDLAYHYHCLKAYEGDMGPKGFMNFQNGYATSVDEIKRATHGWIQAIIKKGINVVLLAHATTGTHKNPDGMDYNKYCPLINQKYVWPMLRGWADMVLYMTYQTVVAKDGDKQKGKAIGGSQRILYTKHTATIDAKHRHGLPAEILLPDDPSEMFNTFNSALRKENN